MKNFIVLALIIVSFANTLAAQVFEPIVEGGDYACITFPDGKVKLGKANSDGYSIITESKAKKNLNNRLEYVKGKTQRLKELKQELAKKKRPSDKEILKSLKIFKQVFREGKELSEIPDAEQSKEEKLEFIDQLISDFNTEEASLKFQIKEIDCDKKEPQVPNGFLKLEIVNAPTGVAAVLFAKEGATYYTNAPYCVRGSDGLIKGMNFLLSPCFLFDCSKSGYIGIVLSQISADHVLSVDERASFLAYVQANTVGSVYEVKRLKYVNYEPLTCEQTLN